MYPMLRSPKRLRGAQAALLAPLFTEQKVGTFRTHFNPSGYSCRLESSATRIRSHTNAEHFELRFRAVLTDGAADLELALVKL
jgi:hypothetical protein